MQNHLTNRKKSVIIDKSTDTVGFAGMAQLVEHVIGNDEVISSTLIASSRIRIAIAVRILCFIWHLCDTKPGNAVRGMKMGIWILAFAAMVLLAAAGFFYLARLMRAVLPRALRARLPRWAVWCICAGLILLPSVVLALVLGTVNAAVVLLHLVFFCLVGDLIRLLVKKCGKLAIRRAFSGLFSLAVTVVYLAFGWANAHNVRRVVYTVETLKTTGNFRIAMFADSHLGTTFGGSELAGYLSRIQAENPDVLLICGDFVDESTTKEDMVAACRALGEVRFPYGTYFVFGNHDKGLYGTSRGFGADELVAELEKNGVVVLEDEVVFVGTICLVGRQDASEESDFGGSRATAADLLSGVGDWNFTVVMDHQPRDYANEAAAGADLVLSGHTHGGQVIPLVQLMSLGVGGNDRVYGREARGNSTFLVTSGISDWAFRFKTGCWSEFVLVDINGLSE